MESTKEHAGIRKLAAECNRHSRLCRGNTDEAVKRIEAEINRVLGPILEAANGLKVIKFVSDGDGDWQAITEHGIKKLKAALERFNRGE